VLGKEGVAKEEPRCKQTVCTKWNAENASVLVEQKDRAILCLHKSKVIT